MADFALKMPSFVLFPNPGRALLFHFCPLAIRALLAHMPIVLRVAPNSNSSAVQRTDKIAHVTVRLAFSSLRHKSILCLE